MRSLACEISGVESYQFFPAGFLWLTGLLLNIGSLGSGMPEELDPSTMEEAENSGETWVVDFWASWCGPCQKMEPIYEEVSEEIEDVNFGKVNMEEHSSLATKYGVQALPTILIIRDGDIVAKNEGFMDKKGLKNWVSEKA
jgi:thioredoxin